MLEKRNDIREKKAAGDAAAVDDIVDGAVARMDRMREATKARGSVRGGKDASRQRA